MSRLDGSGEGDLSVTPLAERPIRPLMPKSLARDSRRGKEHHPFHSFTGKVKVRTVSHPQKFPKMFSLKGCVCVCAFPQVTRQLDSGPISDGGSCPRS